MADEARVAAQRFKVFQDEVIGPAVFPAAKPLDVCVHQCMEHLTPAEIRALDLAAFRKIETGWHWGPRWSSAWFRVSGKVPGDFKGRSVVLRFSSGTEAQVWAGDEPTQGLDDNRDVYRLFEKANGGEPIDLLIEAACNHRLGLSLFEWDSPEFHQRWKEELPGRLGRCEVAVIDERVRRLGSVYTFARQLLEETPFGTDPFRDLERGLGEATSLIDKADVAASAEQAEAILQATLRGRDPGSATRCYAVGHGHIDTAWLWRIRETKRKCVRTFSSVLELMDRFPAFHFLCSQPQQYVWVKERSPEFYARIADRVKEGRWEPMGAMWIEPDGNLPSGESFVRQILLGTRFFEAEFGERGKQCMLYLPDTFGFAGSLPQIMKLSGIDTFVTNKLWWSETNVFPFTTFNWRGIDGTEVLSHLTPGQDYNATNVPTELLRGQRLAEKHDTAGVNVWLQPYGFGDGGGGPTDWTIENAEFAEDCVGLAEATPVGAVAFCDMLHKRAAAADSLPVWEGEMYLEKHRGTYTTQAQIKRDNCEAEAALRTAEWLCFAGPGKIERDTKAAHESLGEAWRLTLLNQFHDILPGSSIGEVYEDAAEDHARVRTICEKLTRDAADRWAKSLIRSCKSTVDKMAKPIVVFNPTSRARTGWVTAEPETDLEASHQPHEGEDQRSIHVRDVPALGMKIVDMESSGIEDSDRSRVDGRTLRNGLIEARIDEAGRIASLIHVASGRDAARLSKGDEALSQTGSALNQLVLYDDQPRQWEAWDIDADYVHSAEPIATPADEICSGEDESSAWVRVTRTLGDKSAIVQTYRLRSGSPQLDIETWVDWRDRRRLLRALMPVAVRASQATYEIPFGHVIRSTLRNTAVERAQFEVPAHRWMDVSESGFGVAMLNDCKYGHSCESDAIGTTMGLTLLRSPNFPDPKADLGEHRFVYSLMPHEGDWRLAGVDHEAEAMVSPVFAVRSSGSSEAKRNSGGLDLGECGVGSWSPLWIEPLGLAEPRVTAFKRAEGSERRIVRLVEWHGARGRCLLHWGFGVEVIEAVDLLERPMSLKGLRHDKGSGVTTIAFEPFQIVSLAVRTGTV